MFEFPDLNVEHDPDAVAAILEGGLPITFVPFEASKGVSLAYDDVASSRISLPQYLDERLKGWSAGIALLAGVRGALLFDPVAVAYVLWPTMFWCYDVTAAVREGALMTRLSTAQASNGTYCVPSSPRDTRSRIISALASQERTR